MTDYWVSKDKYYCKICNVWLSDNKQAIRHHEQGKKHTEIVRNAAQKKKDDKWKGEQSEKTLRDELKAVEQAALAAQAADAQLFGWGSSAAAASSSSSSSSTTQQQQQYGSAKAAPPPPPPPPPLPMEAAAPARDRGSRGDAAAAAAAVEDASIEKEDDGCYQVDGIWYLDGKKHEHLLVRNAVCQVFIEGGVTANSSSSSSSSSAVVKKEEETDSEPKATDTSAAATAADADADDDVEEWIDALILSVQLVAIPNTQLTQRKHSVAYYAPGADTETVLNSVPSDRLRLPKEAKEAKEVKEVKPPPPPDEHTGYGGWQTVRVTVVTEEEVTAAKQKNDLKEAAKAQRRAEVAAKAERERLLEEALDADDAMGSYDPWGTGRYRGVDLEDAEKKAQASAAAAAAAAAAEDAASSAGTTVTFKKRKGSAANGAKFKRRQRDDDE